MFCDKNEKNPDQIDNDVIVARLSIKIGKNVYFKTASASSSFIQAY